MCHSGLVSPGDACVGYMHVAHSQLAYVARAGLPVLIEAWLVACPQKLAAALPVVTERVFITSAFKVACDVWQGRSDSSPKPPLPDMKKEAGRKCAVLVGTSPGFNPSESSGGISLLSAACDAGLHEVVEHVLATRPDVCADEVGQSKAGTNPFVHACKAMCQYDTKESHIQRTKAGARACAIALHTTGAFAPATIVLHTGYQWESTMTHLHYACKADLTAVVDHWIVHCPDLMAAAVAVIPTKPKNGRYTALAVACQACVLEYGDDERRASARSCALSLVNKTRLFEAMCASINTDSLRQVCRAGLDAFVVPFIQRGLLTSSLMACAHVPG
jgi:hypothetical protein